MNNMLKQDVKAVKLLMEVDAVLKAVTEKTVIPVPKAEAARQVECRLYENIVDEEKGKLNADGTLNLNPNSKTVTMAYVEPALMDPHI